MIVNFEDIGVDVGTIIPLDFKVNQGDKKNFSKFLKEQNDEYQRIKKDYYYFMLDKKNDFRELSFIEGKDLPLIH